MTKISSLHKTTNLVPNLNLKFLENLKDHKFRGNGNNVKIFKLQKKNLNTKFVKNLAMKLSIATTMLILVSIVLLLKLKTRASWPQ